MYAEGTVGMVKCPACDEVFLPKEARVTPDRPDTPLPSYSGIPAAPSYRDLAMPFIQKHVDYYVGRLFTEAGADAASSLLELGPEAVPPLIAAYHREQSENVRTELLQIIWEFRSPLALGILEEALRHPSKERWRTALDGLVALRSPLALGILEETLRHPSKERWTKALDGLVALASPDAIRVLETVLEEGKRRVKPDTEYCAWLQEALEQAREAHAAKQEDGDA